MKLADLQKRLRPERPQTAITIRMPEDLVADLKQVAPLLGFSGYQPLIKSYVGQGLRRDLELLEQRETLEPLLRSLRRQGVAEEIITSALAEAGRSGSSRLPPPAMAARPR